MFRMTDEKGPDDKIIAVPAHDPRLEHLQDLRHLPEFDRLEIQHFFEVYKDLEPGKSVEGATWAGREAAELEIERSLERAGEHGQHCAAAELRTGALPPHDQMCRFTCQARCMGCTSALASRS